MHFCLSYWNHSKNRLKRRSRITLNFLCFFWMFLDFLLRTFESGDFSGNCTLFPVLWQLVSDFSISSTLSSKADIRTGSSILGMDFEISHVLSPVFRCFSADFLGASRVLVGGGKRISVVAYVEVSSVKEGSSTCVDTRTGRTGKLFSYWETFLFLLAFSFFFDKYSQQSNMMAL